MGRGLALETEDDGSPEVFDLVTGRAQRDQPHQSLNMLLLDELPDFVALDGVLRSLPAADLASVASSRIDGNPDPVPVLSGDL